MCQSVNSCFGCELKQNNEHCDRFNAETNTGFKNFENDSNDFYGLLDKIDTSTENELFSYS